MTTMFDQRDQVAFQPVSVLGCFAPYGEPGAAGPTISKPGGVDAWDSCAVSDYGFHYTDTGYGPEARAGLFFRPVVNDKAMIVGLKVKAGDDAPTIAEGFPEYSFFLKNVGEFVIRKDGVEVTAGVPFNPRDLFLTGYNGKAGKVDFIVNNEIVYTATGVADGLKMWAEAWFYRPGGKVRDFQFGPLLEMRFPAEMHDAAGTTIQGYDTSPGIYLDEPYIYVGDWDERMEAPIP